MFAHNGAEDGALASPIVGERRRGNPSASGELLRQLAGCSDRLAKDDVEGALVALAEQRLGATQQARLADLARTDD